MKQVGIVFGGTSLEHEISIISAMQIIAALDQTNLKIIPIYLSKDNVFYSGNQLVNIANFKDIPSLMKKVDVVTFNVADQSLQMIKNKKSKKKDWTRIDVILPIIHGYGMEDGTLSGFFQLYPVPYAGPNVFTGAVSQHKMLFKQLCMMNQINVLPGVAISENEFFKDTNQILQHIEQSISFPLIIKPTHLGSSIGVEIAHNQEELKLALHQSFRYDDEVLCEPYLTHFTEYNCSVLGSPSEQQVSVVEEMKHPNDILSFDDKYISSQSKNSKISIDRIIPAKISEQLTNQIQTISKKVFQLVRASGVSRIDLLFDQNTETLYVNEINTIPGSLSYYLWNKTNMSTVDLILKMIAIAETQYRNRQNKITSFPSNILKKHGVKLKK